MTATVPVEIAQWRRNKREEIRLRLDEYQGHPTFDLRAWYRVGDTDELKPGRSGITLSVSHLARAAEAFARARDEALRLGLIEADKG